MLPTQPNDTPFRRKDCRESISADLVPWMERGLNYLTAQKKERAAYLLTKSLEVFKTLTDVEIL